jgi:endoglucanase
VLRNGGTFTQYVTGDGARYTVAYNWSSAGMQAMLNAVRATGATNVVLVGAPTWCQDLSKWVEYKPNDPLNQIAAVWHGYPNSDKVGDPKSAQPKLGSIAYTWAQKVLDAGYPVVIITEFGDHNAPGTRDAPFVSNLLPWADKAGASYLGWAWGPWKDHDNVLIKDASGTPTDGYGEYVKQHYLCVAESKLPCR